MQFFGCDVIQYQFVLRNRLLVQNLTTIKYYKSFDVAKVTKSLSQKFG